MAAAIESAYRDRPAEGHSEGMTGRTVPILQTPTIQMSAPSPGEPMEITTPTNSSAPQSATKSPEGEPNDSPVGQNGTTPKNESQVAGSMGAPAVAAAAVHQPKIVQTAFIHKLYNMLEDQSIQDLISWSNTGDSFVMSPTHAFSKVLAQYFKHTNISSFVRQLNMYGFHKVSDVFAANGSESTLWEFKHGNGNFRRGDLVGLREIKRRASRHALVHREYNNQKPPPPPPPPPGLPSEPLPMSDGSDPRLGGIEHYLQDVDRRLRQSEQETAYVHMRQQACMDTMKRILHFNSELTRTVLQLVPSPENPTHRHVLALQEEIQRSTDMFRSMDETPHESMYPSRGQYFSGLENAPVSPRQLPQDDPRRSTLAVPQPPRAPNYYRPQVPSNLSISTRRPYGSIGGASTAQSSPSSIRPHAPPPPPPPHHLAPVEPPPGSLARRHTSADIRAHGWQPQPNPFASGPPSAPWPSSPNRAPADDHSLHVRDSFSLHSASQPHSRPETPPPPPFSNGNSGLDSLSSWTWNSGGRDGRSLLVKDTSLPPTRRGSMAHILNPTDTAEREDEDEDVRGEEDRKRKRLL